MLKFSLLNQCFLLLLLNCSLAVVNLAANTHSYYMYMLHFSLFNDVFIYLSFIFMSTLYICISIGSRGLYCIYVNFDKLQKGIDGRIITKLIISGIYKTQKWMRDQK